MRKVVFALGFVCLSACHKKITLSQYKWSSKGGHHKPSFAPDLFNDPENNVTLYDEVIENYKQKVGGAIIDDSFLQKISSKSGDLQFLNAEYQFDLINSTLSSQADQMYQRRFIALELIKKENRTLQAAQHIFEPEVHISGTEIQPQLYYQFEFIPANGNGVYSMRVSPSYAIDSIKRIEKCFEDNRSFVFPTGPRLSDLIETILTPLFGDGTLRNDRIGVSSLNGQPVHAENGEFVFSPEDPRFDQVQAFFFAQKTLDYAETHWDFTLPFTVEMELNAGYPEKTDLMYYHKRLIRLGEGHLNYKNIPRDPSIVTHEVSHAIIDAISAMDSEGETGAINEGFADYITATIWQIPELGHTAYIKRPFTRTVDVPTLYTEKNGGTYHDSGILSGTFWEIEKHLGTAKTQKLALKTIARLGAHPQFVDIYPAALDAAKAASLTTDEINTINGIFSKRQWPIK